MAETSVDPSAPALMMTMNRKMKIDLYHLYRHLAFTHLAFPIILDVLKLWAESAGWLVRVAVCKEQQVDLATDADIIGFSVYTQTAPAAYRLSDKLRRRGKVVILGGPHFRGRITYPEAAPHCDAVVSSICKAQWQQLLTDVAGGRRSANHHPAIYIVDHHNHFRYPDEFYEPSRSQKWYQVASVPTSIGCPYSCHFCSPYLPGKYILRNIRTIYKEIANISRKMIFLCDASFGINKRFAVELMNTLAPLDKRILVETTLARLKDKDILNALAFGGVKWIVIGIESLSLKLTKHGAADVEAILKPVVDQAHELGLVVQGNLICGLDCDGPESFERLYRFFEESNLDSIMLGILTPYPNTKLYGQFQKEGRILDSNWEHYDYHHVVYQPLRMSVSQLIDGYRQLYHEISKTRWIFKEALRVYRNSGIRIQSAAVTAYNIYNKFVAQKEATALSRNQELSPANSKPTHPSQVYDGREHEGVCLHS
jgi:radical SAM superfamily enzyme YgiQ (UPF0313 family)